MQRGWAWGRGPVYTLEGDRVLGGKDGEVVLRGGHWRPDGARGVLHGAGRGQPLWGHEAPAAR